MLTTVTDLNLVLVFTGTLFLGANAAPLSGLNIPMNAEEAHAWRPPQSLVRPNIATNVNFGFATTVDKNTGLVNLAGGIADGFGVDAGFLANTHGNSVTFTGGEGSANAGIRNSAVGNGGVGSFGNVDTFVPMVPNGLALSKALTRTNAIGPMSMAGGHASGNVGPWDG